LARRKVNPQKIEDTALALAKEAGFDQLSLIAVARHLGIKSPSLFNHVSGLADLKGRVALRVMQDLRQSIESTLGDKTGEVAVMALANAYRTWVKNNPGLYPAVRGVGPHSSGDLAGAYYGIIEMMVSVFATTGMTPDDQIHQARALRATLHGWVELEREGSFAVAKDLDWSFSRMMAAFARSSFELS
jgi:AcrR family transcriptional regulator